MNKCIKNIHALVVLCSVLLSSSVEAWNPLRWITQSQQEKLPLAAPAPSAFQEKPTPTEVLDVLKFMEQAGIDPDEFYNFVGTDEQNRLHEKMGDFLLAHAHELVVAHDGANDQLNDDNPQTVIQQGYAAAFDLNKAQLMTEAELAEGISHNLYQAFRVDARFAHSIGDCIKNKIADPEQLCRNLVHKAARSIVNAKITALAAVIVATTISPAAVPVGAAVVGAVSVAQECLRYKDEWNTRAQEVQEELANFHVGELTPLQQRYVDSYWRKAQSNFVTDLAAKKVVGYAEKQAVNGAVSTVGSFATRHPKIREMADYCKSLEQSALQSSKHVYYPVKERVEQCVEWVKQKRAKNA